MKVAVLFSGGKDSTYAAYLAQQQGHELTHLVSMKTTEKHSWMFHSINIHLVDLLAECMNIHLISQNTAGKKEQELEDLKTVLSSLNIEGVVSGAIASEYQRKRINRICDSLGISSFTPLWGKNQERVLIDQLDVGFDIRIVGVYAEGLDASWLGKQINKQTVEKLKQVHDRYGINIAGEGGEYETLVVDAPLFHKRLQINQAETAWHRDYGTLNIIDASVESKP